MLRLRVEDEGDWDATIDGGADARSRPPNGERPDARLAADEATWRRIAADVRGGMDAFRARAADSCATTCTSASASSPRPAA